MHWASSCADGRADGRADGLEIPSAQRRVLSTKLSKDGPPPEKCTANVLKVVIPAGLCTHSYVRATQVKRVCPEYKR
jgi:hypothetical protein